MLLNHQFQIDKKICMRMIDSLGSLGLLGSLDSLNEQKSNFIGI